MTNCHKPPLPPLSLTGWAADIDQLQFWVPGKPQTQGSKRAFVRGGRAMLVEAGGADHKAWRHAVNDEARRAWEGYPPLAGSVVVELVFYIQPPASQTRREREAGPIKARSGDLDKLARCCLDSMTGVVYLDDSQVRPLVVDKRWAEERGPGVLVTVSSRIDTFCK